MEGVTTRKIVIEDYEIINKWLKMWDNIHAPRFSELPDNGLGGIVLEVDNVPVAVNYVYTTNSSMAYLGDAVSDPNFRPKDRFEIGQILIDACVKRASDLGYTYVLLTSSLESVIERCKKSGFRIAKKKETIIMKKINDVR